MDGDCQPYYGEILRINGQSAHPPFNDPVYFDSQQQRILTLRNSEFADFGIDVRFIDPKIGIGHGIRLPSVQCLTRPETIEQASEEEPKYESPKIHLVSGAFQKVNHNIINHATAPQVTQIPYPGQNPGTKRGELVQCKYCPYQRERKSSMKRHVKENHADQATRREIKQTGRASSRIQVCPVCGLERGSWYSLQTHVKADHAEYDEKKLKRELEWGVLEAAP